ncbi:hypothetical protein [Nitrosopumilus sp.]|uniref:hypothetical protein n=1 Tax=Nitrosopumilus sp. TaxID=2024843 RepID=UPI003D0A881B
MTEEYDRSKVDISDDNWELTWENLKYIQDSDLGYVISDSHIRKILFYKKVFEGIKTFLENNPDKRCEIEQILL